ncbi:metallophosphoesterase [Nocardia sp. NPDC004654]|uniref:metallophosphoesterase n=1 Tax=Nocardia sp. NPDC004654 TaxID=3154776 RepID=UPI0033A46F4C
MVVLIGVAVLAVFAGLHWYLWRRLVRDTTAPGSAGRRLGTAVLVTAPLLLLGAFFAESAGLPFPLVRAIAWPGYFWGALFVYLLLALLAGEVLRPVLLRLFARETGMNTATSTEQREEAPEAPGTATEKMPECVAAPNTPVRQGQESGDTPSTPLGAGELLAAASSGEKRSAPSPSAARGRDSGPISRRIFVSRAIAGTAALTAATTVGVGAHGVLNGPQVQRLTIPLAKLPRSADGFRIAVVSDVHLGPILGRGFAERVVRTINDTQPDLIAVVGDLVDGSVEHLRHAVEPLAGLRARHGAYFVTGNHEYFSGAEEWIEHVQDLGLRLLANDRTELPGFDLAGVNDVQGEQVGQGPDFGKALGDRDPARTAVLLAHQPIQIHDAVAHGVDLQLSGHTHGGQLWPGNLLAELANPTVAGLERYGDTQLYVTRGAGAWGPPVRVGAPSDITVVELAATRA